MKGFCIAVSLWVLWDLTFSAFHWHCLIVKSPSLLKKKKREREATLRSNHAHGTKQGSPVTLKCVLFNSLRGHKASIWRLKAF